jgi:hypothetical protein
MKKLIKLTESELIGIIKRVISEQSLVKSIEGRNYKINPDGTLNIQKSDKNFAKVRLTTKLGDINVVNISQCSGGYEIKGKSGNSKCVGSDKISEIINIVDSGKPGEIETGTFTPNIKVKFV